MRVCTAAIFTRPPIEAAENLEGIEAECLGHGLELDHVQPPFAALVLRDKRLGPRKPRCKLRLAEAGLLPDSARLSGSGYSPENAESSASLPL